MPFNPQDRMRDTTTSTSSPFTLAVSSPTQAQNFSGLADGDTVPVEFRHSMVTTEWMMALCTYNTSGPTLTVIGVYASNLGYRQAVTFSAGTIYAICNPSAKRVLHTPDPNTYIDAASWVRRFKAADFQLTGTADNTAVSSWPNKAGSGPAVQASGTLQPVLQTGNESGGLSIVRFDGSNDYLRTVAGSASLTGDFYMAAVVKLNALGSYQTILAFGEEATGKRRELLIKDNNHVQFNGYNADVDTSLTVTTGVVYFLEVSCISGVVTVYANGTSIGTGSPSLNSYTGTTITLGANNAGTENASMDLSEAWFYGAAPSNELRARNMIYVEETYGVTLANNSPLTASLLTYDAHGQAVRSGVSDDGTIIRGIDRRMYMSGAVGASPGLVHTLTSTGTGNVLRCQALDLNSYSAVFCPAYDVALTDEGYGAAFGFGNPSTGAYACSFREAYNLLSATFIAHRIIQSNNDGGLQVYRRMQFDSTTADITFYQRDSAYPSETPIITLKGNGDIVPGSAALATNATAGFLNIPSCAGTPIGTPTVYTGRVPLVYDSTNHILYLYEGSAWKKAVASLVTGAITWQ